GHFVGGLDAHARLDLRQHLASQVAHGCLLPRPRIPYRRSITRTALPSERGSVRGATIVSWTERPIAFRRRSVTRRRRLAITGCSASKPPQRSTSSGPGSTCTSRVARVDDLREPVHVVGTAAERTLERGPHAFRPRLGAEQAVAEPERARVPALRGEALGDVEDERGRTADAGGCQVPQQEPVARGVARRDRHDGHADALGALVKA